MVNWKTVAVPDQTVLIPSDNSYGCNAFKRLSAHCTVYTTELLSDRLCFVANECFEHCYCQI